MRIARRARFSSLHGKHQSWVQPKNCSLLICLTYRSPETSKVRGKMVYASSKDRFKRELDGIQFELQATDPSEMSFDIVKARAF